MSNRFTALTCAAVAGATMLLSAASLPAKAQGVPGGSYLQSCTNVRVAGDSLVADCRSVSGSWNRTALRDVGRCVGGIANMNGNLTCNYGGERQGARDRRDDNRHGSSWDRRDDNRYGSSWDQRDNRYEGYGSSWDHRGWDRGSYGYGR